MLVADLRLNQNIESVLQIVLNFEEGHYDREEDCKIANFQIEYKVEFLYTPPRTKEFNLLGNIVGDVISEIKSKVYLSS
jgi:hypothetical protein